MKLAGLIHVSLAISGIGLTCRADEDYSRSNPAFAPAAHRREIERVTPAGKRSPWQDRRLDEPARREPEASTPAERSAQLPVVESAPKTVLPAAAEKITTATRPPALSALNRRPSALSTTTARKPVLVEKYQAKLAPAQVVTIGRTPATERGGEARLNRFVFRHNPPAPLAPAAAVVPGASAGDR